MTMSPDGPAPSGDTPSKLTVGTIATGSGIAALVVFIVQNTDDVAVSFLVWTFTWPAWLLIIVSATLGALIWLGLGVLRRHQRRKQRREDRRD